MAGCVSGRPHSQKDNTMWMNKKRGGRKCKPGCRCGKHKRRASGGRRRRKPAKRRR